MFKRLSSEGLCRTHKSFEVNFHKIYATELALAAVRLSWYRLYYPKEFEKAYQKTFDDFESETVIE